MGRSRLKIEIWGLSGQTGLSIKVRQHLGMSVDRETKARALGHTEVTDW